MPFRYQSCVDFFIADLCKKKAASIGERRLANALERKGWLNDPHDKKMSLIGLILMIFTSVLVLRIARRRFI